jgi:MoaA/NifB/PqqE/SkfB family radical SAM enzyme
MQAIYRLIKLNRAIDNHRIKFCAVLAARRLRLRHLFLRVDPIVACNLACLMCPYTYPDKRALPNDRFSDADFERLAEQLFPRALQVVTGCSYEPTMSGNFMHVLDLARHYRVPFKGLTTNGQLLTEPQLQQMQRLGLDELTLSCHGVEQSTYETFMVRASYQRFLSVLDDITRLKEGRHSRPPHLRLNYTVNRKNLDELAGFFDVLGDYPLSTLQIRPMFGDRPQGLSLRPEDHDHYRRLVKDLGTECRRRGITLLANTADPNFERFNSATLVLPYVYLYIDPLVVWRADYDWKTETFDEYCKRTNLDRSLVRGVFSNRRDLMAAAQRYGDSAGYEIG